MSNSFPSLEKEMENQKSILKTLIGQIKSGYQAQRLSNPKAWRFGVISRASMTLVAFISGVASLIMINGWVGYVLFMLSCFAFFSYGLNTLWRLSKLNPEQDKKNAMQWSPKEQKDWHRKNQKQFKEELTASLEKDPVVPMDLKNIMRSVKAQSSQKITKPPKKTK